MRVAAARSAVPQRGICSVTYRANVCGAGRLCLVRATAPLVGLALLYGCATHPVTGRDQILALPAVQIVHADVGFALSTGVRLIAAPASCEQDCGSDEDLAKFAARTETIGTQLEASAREESPELFGRIERFQIEVNGALGVASASSPGGRIVLGSGLAALEPTDTVIAFVIAREMAHVIGRHAEENSGAAVITSLLGMLLPGVSIFARFVASTVASNALKDSWAVQQQQEADEIALALLERTGHPVFGVAFGLGSAATHARLPDDDWGARFVESARRIAHIAASQPRYVVFAE
jgi:hypothetical protein